MTSSRVTGVGMFVPERVVTNDDLSKLMDTSDEWIQTRSGIKERRWVDDDVTTSDLAVAAAERALADAGREISDMDMIVAATLSPDHEFPGLACFVQAKMDIPGIPALDIRQQCTGFVAATATADAFIRGGNADRVLVIGAEIHSKGLDQSTNGRDISVLFGDGAGAFILEATDETDGPRVITTHLHADGSGAKNLWMPAPGMAYKRYLSSELIDAGLQYPQMDGRTVFTNAVRRMPEAVMEAVEAGGVTLDDVDLFIFHQANQRINEAAAKQLGIPMDKVVMTIDRYGNTTAATIPIGFRHALDDGRLEPGMLVAVAAFGSGFTWGSMLIRW